MRLGNIKTNPSNIKKQTQLLLQQANQTDDGRLRNRIAKAEMLFQHGRISDANSILQDVMRELQ